MLGSKVSKLLFSLRIGMTSGAPRRPSAILVWEGRRRRMPATKRDGAPHRQPSPRGSGLDVCHLRGISSQAQHRHHPFQAVPAGPWLLTQQHIRRHQQLKVDQQRVTSEAVVQGPGWLLSALGESGSAFGRKGSGSKWEACN